MRGERRGAGVVSGHKRPALRFCLFFFPQPSTFPDPPTPGTPAMPGGPSRRDNWRHRRVSCGERNGREEC